jgi:tetratricopeptide (TPR) repeat protein
VAEWSIVEVKTGSPDTGAERYQRLPVRTHVITEADDIVEVADRVTAGLRQPGDVIVVSESVVAASQGRTVPADEIRPGLLARLLWRFVRKVPYGTGLRSPLSMQCAIEEVGVARILLASLAGALGKLAGRRGDFYRVAGMQAALIDAAYTSGVREFHTHVILGPKDPEAVAGAIADRTGVAAAIMDINDIGGSWVIGASEGVNRPLLEDVMRDNPLGQGDEQTPIGIVRPAGAAPGHAAGSRRVGERTRGGSAGPVSLAIPLCVCALALALLFCRVAEAQAPAAGESASPPPVRPQAGVAGEQPAGAEAKEGPGAEESEAAQRRAEADRLIEQAKEFNRSGDWNRAADVLRQAATIDPSYSQPFRWLGFTYEEQYKRATKPDLRHVFQRDAIAAYARAVAIKPDPEWVDPRLARLFFADGFPPMLDATCLPNVPPRFVSGSCLLVPPDAPAAQTVHGGFAFTVSVIYPPEAPDATGTDVWPTSPKGTRRYPTTPPEALERFNRVSYGYSLQPREQVYALKFVEHYASEALEARALPTAPLAAKVMNALLHFYWYSVVYLGVQPVDVTDVWLSQLATPGGEQTGTSILINDVATPREPIEWIREVAHEYGHLVLPPIGRFVEPEDTGSGILGERLFLAWLAEEFERVAEARWPAKAVQSAANNFWSGEEVAIQSFVANYCDEPVIFWLLKGPDSELVSQQSSDALEWLTGLALYIQAAHGTPMLAQAFRDTQGSTCQDFLTGCENAVGRALEEQELHLNPRAFIPGASRTDGRAFHHLGEPEDLRLRAEDHAVYWIYLPAGSWAISASVVAQSDVTLGLALDAGAPSGLVIRKGEAGPQVLLSDVTQGWHQLTVSAANADRPFAIRDLVVRKPK